LSFSPALNGSIGRVLDGDTLSIAMIADENLNHICNGPVLGLGGDLERFFKGRLNA